MRISLSPLLVSAAAFIIPLSSYGQKFLHIDPQPGSEITMISPDSVPAVNSDTIIIRNIDEILESLPAFSYNPPERTQYRAPSIFKNFTEYVILTLPELSFSADHEFFKAKTSGIVPAPYNAAWLREAEIRGKVADELIAMRMTGDAHDIDYFYSELPTPPRLMPMRPTFSPDAFSVVPKASAFHVKEGVIGINATNWLHILNMNLQFSQAYLSPNWYQGGNNSLTILAGLLWNVKINQVYHPNLLFESNLQYKLGLYSTPNDNYHKYAISEDNFQWNAKAGFKAFKKWFYSVTIQFKTPLLHNYEADGPKRTSAFLSPADLNFGIGLTYSTENKKRRISFTASLSPLSYNLKTCMDHIVDPVQFNISPGKKSISEIGSNAEVNFKWTIADNITYLSRLFLFSNYQNFIGDWENTVSFAINRFLSTQIYVHGRFDTSSEINDSKWKHWMLKEIFSFGFTYNFSTKPAAKK